MKKESIESVVIDDGHYFEMLDRLYVQMCMIEDHLIEHPVSKQLEDVNELIVQSSLSLLKAYQLVGKHSLKEKK